MDIPSLPWDFILPLIVPLAKAVWEHQACKPSRLPNNFFIDLLWRALAFAAGVAYVYSVALKNLPPLNIELYLTTAPLTIIGAAYILNYVWSDLGRYLDASFKEAEAIPDVEAKKDGGENGRKETG